MNLGRIDISLTTISSRIDCVVDTIQSLLSQSYKDVHVRLYISREPYLLDEGIPEIPKGIAELARKNAGRFSVSYCPNIGPYRKLLPFLYEFWGQSRNVVTVDDDTIYPSYWLETLLDAYARYRCQIAYRGHRIAVSENGFAPYRAWMKSKLEENPGLLILPTGKDGVLYNTSFFPLEVLNIDAAMKLAPTADDLWFRWHLMRNGIPVFMIKTDYRDAFLEGDYSSSLYLNFNRGGNNDRAIQDLDEYFNSSFGFSAIAAR